MQAYSNPARANDPHTLPDLEVWDARYVDCPECGATVQSEDCQAGACAECGRLVSFQGAPWGWFWWSCSPGCLPDGERSGPFNTLADALADAREGYEESDDE